LKILVVKERKQKKTNLLSQTVLSQDFIGLFSMIEVKIMI